MNDFYKENRKFYQLIDVWYWWVSQNFTFPVDWNVWRLDYGHSNTCLVCTIRKTAIWNKYVHVHLSLINRITMYSMSMEQIDLLNLRRICCRYLRTKSAHFVLQIDGRLYVEIMNRFWTKICRTNTRSSIKLYGVLVNFPTKLFQDLMRKNRRESAGWYNHIKGNASRPNCQ